MVLTLTMYITIVSTNNTALFSIIIYLGIIKDY